MKTLTITEARKNLSSWLDRAQNGEEIGIVNGSQIIALRPVAVTAMDYMEHEYGLSPDEASQIAANILLDSMNEATQGGYTRLEDIPDAAPARKRRQIRVR